MSSTAPTKTLEQARRLERRIREHQEEVARLRAEMGDPQEALFRFMTERFEMQAFVPADCRDQRPDSALWEEDDDLNAW
jgi:hypothetical protein